MGEVLEGDPALNSFHQGGRAGFDGVDPKVQYMYDFPVYFAIRDAFGRGGPLRNVALMVARDRLYPDPTSLVTLLGSHDERRFMAEPGATTEGLRLAYTFLLTYRGTPLIYYGDEIAMPGGGDPDNRRDFPGGFPATRATPSRRRGARPSSRRCSRTCSGSCASAPSAPTCAAARPSTLHVADQTYAYRRGRTVVALNNDTAAAQVRLAPSCCAAPASPTARRVGRAGHLPAPRRDGGGVTLAIPARSGCVF
jgi:glycosidase